MVEGQSAGGAGADDALVVVSELVTNGVVHDGGDDIKLRVEEADRCLTIDVVTTPRPEGLPPFPRPTADPNETGRGMTVVAALCQHVVTHNDSSGRRHVTCSIALDERGQVR